jgi:nicotinate-nucleotide pyrophosphorylase (carboxylating)
MLVREEMTQEVNLPELDAARVEPLVRLAISEDIGPGDVTSLCVLPEDVQARGVYVVNDRGVVAGLPLVPVILGQVDPSVTFEPLVSEGARVAPGTQLAEISGSAVSILSAERISLNFLQRLSGVATLTAEFVAKVRGTSAKILDTRKTTPGWRCLEKYAVRAGGGTNHRMGLFDQILIKDNHLELSGRQAVTDAVKNARGKCPPGMVVEVEAESIDQVAEALAAGADIIMLDNMPIARMTEAVAMIRSHPGDAPVIEASGNVSLETVGAIARTGVDWISVGCLTHSARALDISLVVTAVSA